MKRAVTSLTLGLTFFVLLVIAALTGAVADRLFIFEPLENLFPRQGIESNGGITQRILREESVVVDVAERVAPSVVTVSITQERQIIDPFANPFGFFGRGEGRTETIEQDIGSGFVVGDGLVVTNKHVVGEAGAEYTIIDRDGNEHRVEQIYRDPANDLAILQVENNNLPSIELGDSENLKVGQFVIAIGTALGEFRHTVTTGVISGLGRGIQAGSQFGGFIEELDNVIQTDAAINPGNSGGPLLNSAGQVIGINTAVSAGAENIGFAIPINILKESLTNFEETGRFDRAFLGVSYQLISRDVALMNEVPAGAYVREVIPGSAAETAGIEQGDIITKIDGENLDEENTLAEIIGKKRSGERVALELWRDGETRQVEVSLSSTLEDE